MFKSFYDLILIEIVWRIYFFKIFFEFYIFKFLINFKMVKWLKDILCCYIDMNIVNFIKVSGI